VNDKLDKLKKYIKIQAEDKHIWFQAETITEAYLQAELRLLAWLIEEASIEQINIEIQIKKENL
jgi:hypothetical protein